MLRFLSVTCALVWAGMAALAMPNLRFASIDGGVLEMSDWAGQPVLVVNAASQCAYTRQYADLQTLYDRYRAQGLVVLAVPSDDFQQELDSAAEVKEFCEMNFGLDLPMTDITSVRGARAHPFYQWVKAETGFVPRWNFNKVLVGSDGQIIGTWGSRTEPLSPSMIDVVEKALSGV